MGDCGSCDCGGCDCSGVACSGMDCSGCDCGDCDFGDCCDCDCCDCDCCNCCLDCCAESNCSPWFCWSTVNPRNTTRRRSSEIPNETVIATQPMKTENFTPIVEEPLPEKPPSYQETMKQDTSG